MPGHSQERRKTLVINKPLQGRMILGMALTPSLALAAIAVLTAVWCTRTMENAALEEAELPNLTPIFYVVVAFELVAAVYLMVNSLKISHRVAGPAYRICKSLERIRSGDLAFTVNLRKGEVRQARSRARTRRCAHRTRPRRRATARAACSRACPIDGHGRSA